MRLTPYIKPTTRKHSSGYRVFECGYIDMNEGNKPTKKHIISRGSDHVFTDVEATYDNTKSINLNMDMTLNGYIRLWGNSRSGIKWEYEDMALSDMSLMIGEPAIGIELDWVDV